VRPLLVLAGTFAPQRISDRYYGALYPTKVLALPGGGRDRLHRTYAVFKSTVQRWILEQDEAVVLVGHSQGAIHALTFALDHPHLVSDVVGIAGPYEGASSPFLAAPNLEQHIGRFLPVGLDFQTKSSYLRELRERAKESEVPLTLVAGRSDGLVTQRSAHAVDPADKVIFSGGHTTVLHQRDTKRLLRRLRE
jgi:pimeloyl-ACP methyl ester carboxylesterase